MNYLSGSVPNLPLKLLGVMLILLAVRVGPLMCALIYVFGLDVKPVNLSKWI